jgi:hypothetical protein
MQEPGDMLEWERNREMEGTKARVYKRPRHGKIIISAPISSWDCEGNRERVHERRISSDALDIFGSPPRLLFSERRTAGSRVTGCVQVRLVARTSDNRASWSQEFNITY